MTTPKVRSTVREGKPQFYFVEAPVGNNLKHALAEKGMTQEALAREIDVSVRIVQEWCSGRSLPRWPSLVRVAEALERTPDWFYAEHEERTPA